MKQIFMPDDFSPKQLEEGRLLFLGSCDFFFGVQHIQQLPPPNGPEIAFAGRSNVGKSTLINALTNRSRLARASSEPGRTKQLNFFLLSSRLTLVDMPGYGFAKAAKSVKEAWQHMMFTYLRGRPNLSRVFLLVDARIELKEADHKVMSMLDHAAVTFQVVLTKVDAVKPSRLEGKVDEVCAACAKHAAAYPHIALTSSETGVGIETLRAEIARVISPIQS